MLRQVVVNVVRHYLPEVDATVGTDRCLFLRWAGVCSGGLEIEVRLLFPEVDVLEQKDSSTVLPNVFIYTFNVIGLGWVVWQHKS